MQLHVYAAAPRHVDGMLGACVLGSVLVLLIVFVNVLITKSISNSLSALVCMYMYMLLRDMLMVCGEHVSQMLGVTQAQGVAEEFNLRFNKAEPNAYKHVTSGVQAH